MSNKARVRNAVDLAFPGKESMSIQELWKALEKDGINIVLRENRDRLIYGTTYVDHRTKCVFNGSALGKQYSAKAIQARCQQEVLFDQKAALQQTEN
jgi:hypothetical protein